MEELKKSFESLRGKKNLLAFSGGVDSSALFFLLCDAGVPFDTACVNYQTRENSNKEAEHVKTLSEKHGKKAYIHICKLDSSNFEHNARAERYTFFEDVISQNGYENLIIAHQLDDRLEWFVMQFCKGAGLKELLGFGYEEKRENYTILRPLWNETKASLLEYLQKNSLPYFLDESNEDTKYKRNFFRKHITKELLEKYENGIRKSFEFLSHDAEVFDVEFLYHEKNLFIYKLQNEQINMRLVDKAMKHLGVLMSESSRLDALKPNAVIGRKIAVGRNEFYGFVAPFCDAVMDKKFKEACRRAKIPKHIRAYMFKENIDIKGLKL